MKSATQGNKRKALYLATLAATSLMLTACGSDDDNNHSSSVAKPSVPAGIGHEDQIAVPSVSSPLPAVDNVEVNEGSGRFYRDTNPINFNLRGINDVWKGTTEKWQTSAGDYTDEEVNYEAGDGPNPHNAVNGQPADYVEEGTEIVDADTWEANIQYVINVTTNRTDEQAYFAFLDDIRSKNYGTIDGFGPLTEDYAANSGASADFKEILLTDVTAAGSGETEATPAYNPDDNDGIGYGGSTDSTLGDMVAVPSGFRNFHASTSGPKYLYGTPRPWRMTDTGTINFEGVESLYCIDGSTEDREVKQYRFDQYESSVKVIPGLVCGRRSHNSGKELYDETTNPDGATLTLGDDKAGPLYTATTENRRKDNGYPSGHTNAAVLASLGYAYVLPERFTEHLTRGSDLGENRIVAGMHSPVDVIGGRIQATMVAAAALKANPQVAQAAREQAVNYFGAKAADAGMSLYDYAHRTVSEEGSFENNDGTLNVFVFNNNRYADHAANKEKYEFRLTYGLPQNGTTGLDPVVPEGAEALLASRQPYLSDAQRRVVLASTEVDSGYPLLDKSNGWGRLNLFAAADGYGAFDADVDVYMDASEGGFSALDWWRNDISGAGKLTKDGTGTLVLTGDNSYSGGTVIEGGELVAQSATAFGSGDLYASAGTAMVDADGTLSVENLTLESAAELSIAMDADTLQVEVDDVLYIEDAELHLQFTSAPAAGTEFTLIQAGAMHGAFADVDAGSVEVELSYANNAVVATVK